jgi:cysteine desulfurase
VEYVSDKVIDVVSKLRELSPLYETAKGDNNPTKVECGAH